MSACIQVGYCQGMAFVAGVLLMFVPEEAAWQLLVRLMAEDCVGMRDLFKPGLAGLKRALRMFEWLLGEQHPQLKAHLEVRPGASPPPLPQGPQMHCSPAGCVPQLRRNVLHRAVCQFKA